MVREQQKRSADKLGEWVYSMDGIWCGQWNEDLRTMEKSHTYGRTMCRVWCWTEKASNHHTHKHKNTIWAHFWLCVCSFFFPQPKFLHYPADVFNHMVAFGQAKNILCSYNIEYDRDLIKISNFSVRTHYGNTNKWDSFRL